MFMQSSLAEPTNRGEGVVRGSSLHFKTVGATARELLQLNLRITCRLPTPLLIIWLQSSLGDSRLSSDSFRSSLRHRNRCQAHPPSPKLTAACLLRPGQLLAFAFLLVATATPSLSQDASRAWLLPFGENAAEDLLNHAAVKKADREADDAEEPEAVILARDLALKIDEAGRLHSTRRTVVHLLTQEGVDYWSDVSAYWSPWHEERPQVRARVISGENDRRLSADTLFERTAEDSEDIYGDRKVLEGPLPAVAIGAVVDLEVKMQETAPHFAPGSSFSLALDSWFPIVEGSVTVRYPVTSLVRTECGGLGPDAVIEESQQDGSHVLSCTYSHEARDLKRYYSDLVDLNPAQVRISTAADWNSVASAYSSRIEEILASSKKVLAAGTSFKGSRKEKINQALDWMQERIRYTGLELGESAIIPYTPKTVLDRGYGDCKDLATILVGLLDQAGIAADIALVRPGRDLDVNPDFPGLGHFTHAIVRVNAGKGADDGELWVDPTSQFSAAGELPSSDQGRMALVAHPETSTLVKVTDLGASANGVKEVRRINMASFGNSSASETTGYTGDFAAARRNAWRDYTSSDLDDSFTDYASSTYGVETVSAKLNGLHERGKPLGLDLEVEKSVRFVADLNQAVAVLDPTTVLGFVPNSAFNDGEEADEAEEREAGADASEPAIFEFPTLHEYHVRYVVTPPAGMALRDLPEVKRVELPGGAFEATYDQADDGTVNAQFTFDLHQRRLTADQLEDASIVLTELATQDPILLWFDDEASVMMELGQAKESLALRERLAAEHPADPAILTRLAIAWLSVGLRDAALAAADDAVAQTPDSALAHWARGWILQHGDTAAQIGPGFDHQAAVESLRKAVEIATQQDEDASDYTIELSVLLEHDEDGVRYQGDLAEANALIHEKAQSDEPDGTETNYLINLFRQRKYKQVLAEWKELRSSDVMQVVALAAAVADKDSAAGMRLLRSFGKAGADRASVLGRASAELSQQGYFDEASELLRAAAPASGNAAAYLNRARLLESAAKLTDTLPDGSAQNIAGEALVESLLGVDLSRERLVDMFHPLAKETVDDALWAGLIATRTSMVRSYAEAGQALDTLNDASKAVFLAAFDVTVEGDHATGWKVVFENSTAGGGKTAFLLAMDGDQAKLASWDTETGGSVLVARDFFLRSQLKAAKTWLEWRNDVLPAADNANSLLTWLEDREPEASTEGISEQDQGEQWLVLRLFADLADHGFGSRAMELHDRVVAFAQQQDDPELSRRLEWSLLLAYLYSGDIERAQTSFDRAWQASSASGPVNGYDYNAAKLSLLIGADQLKAALPLARKMMEQEPDNELGATLLSTIALEMGDLEVGLEGARRVLELSPGDTGTNNNLAWMLLFGEDPQFDEARDLAERGTARATHATQAELHTLATVYAFSGDPQTALATIRQSLALHPKGEAEPHDWIVFGRIAEEFGQRELAIDFYNRVMAEEGIEAEPPNTKALAKRRLEALAR